MLPASPPGPRRGIETSLIFALASAFVLAVVAAGCGGSEAATGGPQVLEVTLVDAGCSPENLEATSGAVTFDLKNGGTTKVSELEVKQPNGIILGEKENIVGALTGSFTLTLQPGRYILSCPTGLADNQGELIVSGERVASPELPRRELNGAVAAYRVYVARQVRQLVKGVDRFAGALETGDVAKAKDLFGPARLDDEQIEPVAESFGDLDPRIDARENDVSPGTSGPASTGSRRSSGSTARPPAQRHSQSSCVPMSQRSSGRARRFTSSLRSSRTAPSSCSTRSRARRSPAKRTATPTPTCPTIQGNLDGARKAFELLRPALVKSGEGDLAETIAARFTDVQDGLDKYRRATPLGFALYNELTPADRRTLARRWTPSPSRCRLSRPR